MNGVSFKGRLNQLEIRIPDGMALGDAAAQITAKFEAGRNFFAGSGCVYILTDLGDDERIWLSAMLKRRYGILDVEFGGVPRPARRELTPERRLFMEFENACQPPRIERPAQYRFYSKSLYRK